MSWTAHAARHEALILEIGFAPGRLDHRTTVFASAIIGHHKAEDALTADIIEIRDFQNKRDIERLYQALEDVALELKAIEIANVALIPHDAAVASLCTSDPENCDCETYEAPESDPA